MLPLIALEIMLIILLVISIDYIAIKCGVFDGARISCKTQRYGKDIPARRTYYRRIKCFRINRDQQNRKEGTDSGRWPVTARRAGP